MKTVEEMLDKASSEAAMEEVFDTMETSFKRVDVIRKEYFKEGAKWMRKELTRWHDPKNELPKTGSPVLCKVEGYTESDYLTLSYSENSWWIFHTESSPFGPVGCQVFFPHEVLAWREIHE